MSTMPEIHPQSQVQGLLGSFLSQDGPEGLCSREGLLCAHRRIPTPQLILPNSLRHDDMGSYVEHRKTATPDLQNCVQTTGMTMLKQLIRKRAGKDTKTQVV